MKWHGDCDSPFEMILRRARILRRERPGQALENYESVSAGFISSRWRDSGEPAKYSSTISLMRKSAWKRADFLSALAQLNQNQRQQMRKALLIPIALAVGTVAAFAGNGAPSGSHYNLNILGKRDCTPADLTGSERHTIQVLLNGGQKAEDINGTLALTLDKQNKIFLAPGDSFQVI